MHTYCFRPLWGSFLFLFLVVSVLINQITKTFPSPMGIFFISIISKRFAKIFLKNSFRPLWGSFLFLLSLFLMYNSRCKRVSVPYGDLFYFYRKMILSSQSWKLFPSPMGIFFISILSYGNLTGYRESLHFAVQKVFSGKIRGF